jgi:hypothetical protein
MPSPNSEDRFGRIPSWSSLWNFGNDSSVTEADLRREHHYRRYGEAARRYSASKPTHAPNASEHITKRMKHNAESNLARLNDPTSSWSDLEVIKSWLRECDSHHSSHCQGVKGPSDTLPMWLIDVGENCIVKGNQAERYVALSYVWGKVESLQAMTVNIEQLQKAGRLLEQDYKSALPRTILHAMQFTKLIGERHLWVDRLCIVQDDEATRRAEINNMMTIYASAYITVVAAGGISAQHGLQGVENLTLESNQRQGGFLPGMRYPVQAVHYGLIGRSEWSLRGWTFQEFVFSQRAIFFFNSAITWECHCAVWNEGISIESSLQRECRDPKRYSRNARGFHYTSWPDLEEYHRLVREYNKRKLTYTADTLPAFAGITSALSRTFQGGFIYGLSVQFFDVTLLWQPFSPLQRRQSCSQTGKPVALRVGPG